MIEFRLLETREEFEQAAKLADVVFKREGTTSMATAFPQVFSTSLKQSYGAFEDGRLVSFIGLVPSVLHIHNAELQVYSIGTVCTHPDYRKRGLANTLLQKIFDHIQKAEGSLLFVSGALPLYLKQGCTPYSKVNKYKLVSSSLSKSSEYTVREMNEYDWFRIRKIGNERHVRYEQSIFDLAMLKEASGYPSIFRQKNKVLVAEFNNEMKAFIVFTVPVEDTANVESHLMEWGGDPSAIRTLLAETFQYNIEVLNANIPSYDELINELKSTQFEQSPFPYFTVKIIDIDRLLQQLEPYFEGKVEIEKIDDSTYQITNQKEIYEVSIDELQEWLLHGTTVTNPDLERVFPIPFPSPQGLNYV